MLPESGMSCSVCHLHLMLFYLEIYERNKMMIMMTVPCAEKVLSTALGAQGVIALIGIGRGSLVRG